ncbi:MAG: AbiH family protein [Bacilli bacterium]|nr:AbiH family protein [Bacilli bacterium]
MSKLAIVGNGFDMAHGLKTGYHNFYENLESDLKSRWVNLLMKFNIQSNDWFDFEEAINKLTEKWNNQYFESYEIGKNSLKQQNILLEKVNQINLVFSELTEQLYLYISIEEKKPVMLKKSIQEILTSESYVITFNYTNLMKRYCNNVYHIHGSIDEGYIILGYKLRAEQTGMAHEATKYNKYKLREKLSFRRFLQSKKLDDSFIFSELEEFDKHIDCLSSGRGGYYFDYSKKTNSLIMEYIKAQDFNAQVYNSYTPNGSTIHLPNELEEIAKKERLQQLSSYINEYGQINNFQSTRLDTGVPYSDIEEVIILGHSLKADIADFEALFPLLKNLKIVVLFIFNGEEQSEIIQKKETLRKLTSCPIIEKMYD